MKRDYKYIIESFGLKTAIIRDGDYCWTGDGIIRSNSPSNFLHELAHWQIAPPYRRKLVNFGLGECPDESFFIQRPERRLTIEKARDEENLASCLGILWEKKLGMDWKTTYNHHGWDDGVGAEFTFKKTAKRLVGMGLVSKNRVPYGPKGRRTHSVPIV